jgi:hypothetical protein
MDSISVWHLQLNDIRSILPTRYILLALLLSVLFLIPACNKNNDNPVNPDPFKCSAGQWGEDTGGGYAYAHDCNPYVGAHFSVFSDGSSREAKQQLAQLAEGVFTELCQEFMIQNIESELQFTPGYTYYIYAQKHMEDIKAMGYRNGFFIAAFDCVTIPNPYTRNPAFYTYLVKHEMTHVFQFTLTDCPSNNACPEWLGVWFREGHAIVSGGHLALIIDTIEEYQTWKSDPSHINPIEIHRWVNFPDPDRGGEYYPMFGLAYAYLVDTTHGLGSSISDMRDMFEYMKEGDGFYEAFEKALGISVTWYKENFYTLMEQYLNSTSNLSGQKLNKPEYWVGEY